MTIYDIYFKLTAETQQKYGERSVVFMLVGQFYEIYGIRKDGNEFNTNIEDVCRICGIIVKPKEKTKRGYIIWQDFQIMF